MGIVDSNDGPRQTLSPIREALDIVETEREEIQAELDAFTAFRRTVASIQTRTSQPSSGALPVGSDPSVPHLETIRASYRDTVMDTQHYDDMYDESMVENWTEEFGPELAAWVSSENPVTPEFKSSLLTAVDRCRHDRATALEVLEAERASLSDSYAHLETVLDEVFHERSNNEIQADARHHLERECQAVIENRQEVINNQQSLARLDGHELCTYLYRSTHWEYPVLTVVASVLETVNHGRE